VAETRGTYSKMSDGEQAGSGGRRGDGEGRRGDGEGRRHRHRHHSHHRHREGSRAGRQTSTDTSLDLGRPGEGGEPSLEAESKYQDSLYSPQPTREPLYGPGRDSVYSGEEPGRLSPRPRSKGWEREGRHGENTFDHVSRGAGRRGQEERIWQDPVSRGAESGQIRGPPAGQGSRAGKAEASPLRAGYIEPGRPGSGLAAAAALARGEPLQARGGKLGPPVAQKPEKARYNRLGMEEVWAGGWDDYGEYSVSPSRVTGPRAATITVSDS
jgi:hypothetical protein